MQYEQCVSFEKILCLTNIYLITVVIIDLLSLTTSSTPLQLYIIKFILANMHYTETAYIIVFW